MPGNSVVTMFVENLDERVAGISAHGIEPVQQEAYEDGVRKVIYRDSGGNEVSLGSGPT
jgi:hypothetical protein